MWKHCCDRHERNEVSFVMNVTGFFRDDTMLGKITESVLINKVEEVKLINSKSEWNYGCCDTVASLETWLRAAIFRVLLHEACVFSKFFICDQVTRS